MPTWLSYSSARAWAPMYRTHGGVAVSPSYIVDAWFEKDVSNPSPVITGITPNFGGSTLETEVTITGSNFGAVQGKGYIFCKWVRAARVTSWSDTQIVCQLGMHPSRDGLSDLTVTRDSGQSGTLTNAFDAKPTPYISIMPVTVSVYGGTKIKLRGWNFLSAQGTGTVTVDGIAVEQIISWSDRAIDAITPGHVTNGTVNVVVTNSLGYSGTLQITTSSSIQYQARWYVDPLATGAGTGLYPEDAFTSIITAMASVNVTYRSQTIYCKGEETLGAGVRITQEILASFGKLFRIIGCNSAWRDDGTKFTINFNVNYVNGITYCWQTAVSARWYVKNLHVTNSGTNTLGFTWGYSSAKSHNILINVSAPALCFDQVGYAQALIRCDFSVHQHADGFICFTRIRQNIGAYPSPLYYASVIRGANVAIAVNCVIDGSYTPYVNGLGASSRSYGCRVTNSTGYGKAANPGYITYLIGTFFLNNTSGAIGTPSGNYYEKQISVETTGVEGYVDKTNGNFNLTSAATLRNVEINIGCYLIENINKNHISAGLNPSLKVGLNAKSRTPKFVGVWSPRG